MRFYLRLIALTVFRFLILTVFAICVQNFEVSPLPNWTLIAFAYVVQFFITAGFAYWLFRGHAITVSRIITTFVVFILGNTILEVLVYLFIIRGDIRDVWANYTWRVIPLLVIHLAAVYMGIRTRKHRGNNVAVINPINV